MADIRFAFYWQNCFMKQTETIFIDLHKFCKDTAAAGIVRETEIDQENVRKT